MAPARKLLSVAVHTGVNDSPDAKPRNNQKTITPTGSTRAAVTTVPQKRSAGHFRWASSMRLRGAATPALLR
jgi:hypothetical protein